MSTPLTAWDPGAGNAGEVQEARVYTGNATGVIPSAVVCYVYGYPDQTVDVNSVIPAGYSFRLIDMHGFKVEAAGTGANTLQARNGTTAITNAINMNVADELIVRAGTIDDAQWSVAAGGTFSMVSAGAGNNQMIGVAIGIME